MKKRRRSFFSIKLLGKKIKKIIPVIIKVVIFFIFPLFIVLLTDFVSKGCSPGSSELIKNLPSFISSYFLVLIIFGFLFILLGRFSFFIAIILFILLGLIHFYKDKILDEPLFPSDLFLHGGSFGKIINFVDIKIDYGIILVFLVAILISGLYYILFSNFKLRLRSKIIIGLLLLILNAYVLLNNDFRLKKLRAFTGYNIDDMAWRQEYNYEHNGFIMAFYTNISDVYVKKPKSYSKNTINKILSNVKTSNLYTGENIKPNVVFILSEAFWDVTKIPSLTFSQDPLANFKKLKLESISGNMVSPTYGGKTELVEFEILTGNMTKFLPFGSMPYAQYIKNPIPTIVQEFKKNSYKTIAIHTYEKKFFNRDKVYPLLGFDQFIGLEDFTNPKYKGPFVADIELTNDIIYNLKIKDSKPLFIFAISMENHFTYEGEKFTDYDVKISSKSQISEKSLQILNNYTQGLYDADKALGKLIDFLKTQKEPTIAVFLGDHLGSMGDQYYTYKETGFLSSEIENEWNQEELLKMYSTEFIIWNNFSQKKDSVGYISAAYFGNYILDLLNFKSKNPYFMFISQEYNNCIKVNTPRILIDKENNFNSINSIKKECMNYENNHNLLQYDILFGEYFLYNSNKLN